MKRAFTHGAGSILFTLAFTLSAGAETVAITGATVHTLGAAGTLENATVVIADGRIEAVGKGIAIPAGARRIDAAGKVVTPGLFDSLSRLGLVDINAVAGSNDISSTDTRLTAALDVTDAINPRSPVIAVARVDGMTRTMVAPSGGNRILAGQGAVIHLGGTEGYVTLPRAAMFAALGESGAGVSGGSRAAAVLALREAFADALDYAAHRDSYDAGERRGYALSRLDLEALVPVVRGEMPLVISVHRASDIEVALKLAREFELRLVLAGTGEGWKVARQIARARVPVLLEVTNNLPANFERLGATLENAARLQAAGVTVAIVSGEAHNARNIKQAAGIAVAYGMPWEEALKAVTVNPARIWGLADRIGTLAPGLEADLVVWDGDPLEVTTYPDHVFIQGEEIPLESRQTKLRDRYLKGGDLPPAWRRP